ncbi:hypothetical protein C1646_764260 [Rhizophagus diaphanus]|nr:hypothetical protein C1646_764260 [Rhizophagus diaphanus] [Rhizophagus sp. MUCL 43196]
MILDKLSMNFPFLLILPLLFINVEADGDRLDTPDNINNFRLIVGFSLTLIILGWFGCIYVFYRIYKQWLLSKKRLAMIYRLPFYTACSDFLINFNFFTNMIHTAIYAQVWDDAPCKVIGAFNWAFLTINLCFYVVIAIITYFRVCREIYFHYGKYDYKLWLYVLAGSSALQVLNIQNNGKRDYWCAAKSGQINSAIILFSTIGIVLIVILFCYLSILRKIYFHINDSSTSSSSNHNDDDNVRSAVIENHTEIERRAAKKILSYTAMFMLQWIPMLISQGARLVENEEPWVYIMGTIGRSFGGVGNVIQFIINEGFIVKTNINISDDNNDNNNILLKSNNNSDIHLESHINNSNDNKIIIISENN